MGKQKEKILKLHVGKKRKETTGCRTCAENTGGAEKRC